MHVIADASSSHRQGIVEFAAAAALPAVSSSSEFAAEGWLDVVWRPTCHRLAPRRRLCGPDSKGARRPELPVEQPTKFELVVNLKTAKALGLDHAAIDPRPRR